MKKVFYVCSYGGCGSKMLCNALKKYGIIEHVHSRKPPSELKYVGGKKTYCEWFNDINVPEDEIKNFYVIYIYKNPVKSILSRYQNQTVLKHVQLEDKTVTIDDLIREKKDLFKIKEFYDNYTKPNKRNYKIICVKYEDIFEKQDELSRILGIGSLNLKKKETKREYDENKLKVLNEIYKPLLEEMSNNDFIFIS